MKAGVQQASILRLDRTGGSNDPRKTAQGGISLRERGIDALTFLCFAFLWSRNDNNHTWFPLQQIEETHEDLGFSSRNIDDPLQA